MKTCVQYLDEAKARAGLSDYALAKKLGLNPSALSVLRAREGTFSNETAVKVAEILGTDPAEVLLDANAQRATDEQERKAWASLRKQIGKLGKKAACVLLAGAALSAVQAPDAQARPAPGASDSSVYYVK